VRRDLLLTAVEHLRKAGATEVTVHDVHYVFEHRSWSFEALQRRLSLGRQGTSGPAAPGRDAAEDALPAVAAPEG